MTRVDYADSHWKLGRVGSNLLASALLGTLCMLAACESSSAASGGTAPTASARTTPIAPALESAKVRKFKTAECNTLVGFINSGVEALNRAAQRDAEGTAELSSMADTMDRVAADISKIAIASAELKKYAEEYQRMAKDTATAARDMAAAARAGNTAKMEAAQATLDAAVKREDPIVDKINALCQSL